MQPWQYAAAVLAAGLILLLAVRSAVVKKRKQKQRDFDRKLETVLQARETVKVVCPQREGNCVLTSARLLFETKEGFTAVPLTKIKRLQGMDSAGKATASAAKMARLTVKAGTDYTIDNTADAFPELVKQLKAKTKKPKKGHTAAKKPNIQT